MDQEARILLSLTRFLVPEGDKNLKYMRWVKRVEKLRDSVYELREAPFKMMSPLHMWALPKYQLHPPPHSGHSGALFFRRDFTIFRFLPFFFPFLPFFS